MERFLTTTWVLIIMGSAFVALMAVVKNEDTMPLVMLGSLGAVVSVVGVWLERRYTWRRK